MSVDTRYFVDVFGDIVSNVREQYDPVSDKEPYYLYGHILDILDRLSIKDESSTLKFEKYPLIMLIQDFEEVSIGRGAYEYNIPEVKVIIATETDPDYDSTKRYENTFKPILYPIWEYLLKSIVRSDYLNITSIEDIEYSKFDRVFWGKESVYGVTSNNLNDYLDAIEIKFKNLKLKKYLNC